MNRAAATTGNGVYQLKVTLLGARPSIWRRLRVPSQVRLARLHLALVVVMGWQGGHLYEFEVGERRYGEPWPKGSPMAILFGDDTDDANRVELRRAAPRAGDHLTYIYDLGDDWRHEVLVERTSCPRAATDRVICVDGRRACPPEDCGGVLAYRGLLAALEEPDEPESRQRLEWVGGPFDPDPFDASQVTRRLAAFSPVPRAQPARGRA